MAGIKQIRPMYMDELDLYQGRYVWVLHRGKPEEFPKRVIYFREYIEGEMTEMISDDGVPLMAQMYFIFASYDGAKGYRRELLSKAEMS